MRVNLIYARARNGVIGRDGGLPWHLPEDLAHFKRQTAGCPVIMGRKTWDSLPGRFRPLPGRQNLVLTRQMDWHAEGARACGSLGLALDSLAQPGPAPAEVWVIGGAQLYALALPLAQRIVVTELELDAVGDAHAPLLDRCWVESSREAHNPDVGIGYAFVTYARQPIAPGN